MTTQGEPQHLGTLQICRPSRIGPALVIGSEMVKLRRTERPATIHPLSSV